MGDRRIYQIRKLLAKEIEERIEIVSETGDYDDEIGTMGVLVCCRILMDKFQVLEEDPNHNWDIYAAIEEEPKKGG